MKKARKIKRKAKAKAAPREYDGQVTAAAPPPPDTRPRKALLAEIDFLRKERFDHSLALSNTRGRLKATEEELGQAQSEKAKILSRATRLNKLVEQLAEALDYAGRTIALSATANKEQVY